VTAGCEWVDLAARGPNNHESKHSGLAMAITPKKVFLMVREVNFRKSNAAGHERESRKRENKGSALVREALRYVRFM
jgi:hypothetical protein